MEQQTTLHQGHYEICLPLRDNSVSQQPSTGITKDEELGKEVQGQ